MCCIGCCHHRFPGFHFLFLPNRGSARLADAPSLHRLPNGLPPCRAQNSARRAACSEMASLCSAVKLSSCRCSVVRTRTGPFRTCLRSYRPTGSGGHHSCERQSAATAKRYALAAQKPPPTLPASKIIQRNSLNYCPSPYSYRLCDLRMSIYDLRSDGVLLQWVGVLPWGALSAPAACSGEASP